MWVLYRPCKCDSFVHFSLMRYVLALNMICNEILQGGLNNGQEPLLGS
jgi:hypothetical protein